MVLNKDLRRRILEKGIETGHGTFGPAFSCLDCIKYLYDNVLRDGIDKFILSKGHGDMALFAVLESKGKKPTWTVHLDYNESEGIYATTGSLGHGLPIGLGRAFAYKLQKKEGKIYVLLGDGEMEEGSNWEAFILANSLNIDNLVILIDWNKYQAVGNVQEIAKIDDLTLSKKLEAFGYRVLCIDGHNENELSKLKYLNKGLNAVILNTILGKGVKFIEDNHFHVLYWHHAREEYEKALQELK